MIGLGDVTIGETVFAYWEPFEGYFVGTVVERNDTGYRVVFEDGDQAKLNANQIHKFRLEVGMDIIARWDDGAYYSGKIAQLVGRACYIHYDDGDRRWVPLSWLAMR